MAKKFGVFLCLTV